MIQGWLASDCNGQLFGNRQTGQPLGPQASAGDQAAGNIQGNERFLRSNRSQGDFVGLDLSDVARFVGQINAQNPGRAIRGFSPLTPRPNLSPEINRPLQNHRSNSLHEPVLQLGFELAPEKTVQLAVQAQSRAEKAIAARFENQIVVSVEGRIATLRGEVGDEEDSRLAEAIVRMEPGVSEVRNEVQIRSNSEPPSR